MRKKYRVRNWREYNKALVNCGSLTVWFDQKLIVEWHKTLAMLAINKYIPIG